jgi:hypothetical protein
MHFFSALLPHQDPRFAPFCSGLLYLKVILAGVMLENLINLPENIKITSMA